MHYWKQMKHSSHEGMQLHDRGSDKVTRYARSNMADVAVNITSSIFRGTYRCGFPYAGVAGRECTALHCINSITRASNFITSGN